MERAALLRKPHHIRCLALASCPLLRGLYGCEVSHTADKLVRALPALILDVLVGRRAPRNDPHEEDSRFEEARLSCVASPR